MHDQHVSVVLPTHQRPQLLAQALRSALAQREVDVEVIVVDDGSAPGAVDEVLPPEDERVRVLRHDTARGVSAARNAGVRAASAPWVAFLDDDDVWAPDKLAAQFDAIAADPDCGWSHVGSVLVDGSLQIMGWMAPPHERDVAVPMLVNDVVSCGSGVLASRDLLATAGPFDPALSCCADWDLFLRLAQHSPLASVHRPLLGYRIHPSSMSSDVDACYREFEILCDRYASLREAAGVAVDRSAWDQWRAHGYLRAGDRRRALGALLAGARTDQDWGRFARSAVVTALPGGAQLRDRRQSERVPGPWRAEAESWLASYREPARPWA